MTNATYSEFFGPPSMARSTLEGGKGGCLKRSATLWTRGFGVPRGLDRGGPLGIALGLLMLSACQQYVQPAALRQPGFIVGAMIIALILALVLVAVLNALDSCDTQTGAIIVVSAIVLGFVAEGCAIQQPTPQLPPPVVAQTPKPKPRHIVTPAEILAAQPPEVQQIIGRHENGRPWPTLRHGTTVWYAYDADSSPAVNCAALHDTDIALAPGETISDVALGDAQRWMAMPASAGDPHNPSPHLVVKPEVDGIETDAIVYTTARVYHLELRAGGHAMREVEFYYPNQVQMQMAAAAQALKQPVDANSDSAEPSQSALPEIDPSHLNFSYKINGAHVAWSPSRVFDDGERVYLQMPSSMHSAPAPALMLDGNGGQQMVNYRVVPTGIDGGSYYVVDRLFDRAELVSGVGRNSDRVLVTYSGNPR